MQWTIEQYFFIFKGAYCEKAFEIANRLIYNELIIIVRICLHA